MKIPTDAKDIKTIRDFLTEVRSQLCSVADYLSEPWKSHFTGLKDQYDSALKDLPPTDQVPAAMEANRQLSAFYSCLASANSLVAMLGSQMNSLMKGEEARVATALNSAVEAKVLERIKGGELIAKTELDGLVTTAIEGRTKSGDLVPKATVTQLCSAAKELGMADGEKKVRDEIAIGETRKTTIATRKAHLQTCGLPMPEAAVESILAGTEDEFKAIQKTAEERIAALQKKGVALNSKSPLSAKVYLPKDQYEVFEELAVQTIKGGDPLAGTPGGTNHEVPAGIIC